MGTLSAVFLGGQPLRNKEISKCGKYTDKSGACFYRKVKMFFSFSFFLAQINNHDDPTYTVKKEMQ